MENGRVERIRGGAFPSSVHSPPFLIPHECGTTNVGSPNEFRFSRRAIFSSNVPETLFPATGIPYRVAGPAHEVGNMLKPDRDVLQWKKKPHISLALRLVILTLPPCSKLPIPPKPDHSGAPEGFAASNPPLWPSNPPPKKRLSRRTGGLRPGSPLSAFPNFRLSDFQSPRPAGKCPLRRHPTEGQKSKFSAFQNKRSKQ